MDSVGTPVIDVLTVLVQNHGHDRELIRESFNRVADLIRYDVEKKIPIIVHKFTIQNII